MKEPQTTLSNEEKLQTSAFLREVAQMAMNQCADLAEKLLAEGLGNRIPEAIRNMTNGI